MCRPRECFQCEEEVRAMQVERERKVEKWRRKWKWSKKRPEVVPTLEG
jgi:hypothetical protein